MTIYKPTEPYVIKSGKRAGKSLEVMMFQDYSFLLWLSKNHNNGRNNGKEDDLTLHLRWLLEKGENRQPKMLCPYCSVKPVEYFSVIYSGNDFSIGVHYTCCGKKKCKDKITMENKIQVFLPFRFSIMGILRVGENGRRRIAGLYRSAFGLPERLTKTAAFEFFNTD